MFELAILETTDGGRRPATFLLSAAGQTAAISLLVAATVLHVPGLPQRLTFTVPAPAGPGAKPEQKEAQPPTRTARRSPSPFVTPGNIHRLDTSRQPDIQADESTFAPSEPYTVLGALPGDARACIGCPAGGDLPARPAPPAAAPPKPQAAPPRAPVRVSTGAQAAKLIHQIKPPYPALAKAARIQGIVRLEAIINRQGSIQDLRVVSGHPLLANAAAEAVRQWRYQPTLLNGEPADVITQIDITFTLQ
jgi:protein TonB